jgi:hypothetical protein
VGDLALCPAVFHVLQYLQLVAFFEIEFILLLGEVGEANHCGFIGVAGGMR